MLGEEEEKQVNEGQEGSLDDNELYKLMSKMYSGIDTITDFTIPELKNIAKLKFKSDLIKKYDKTSSQWLNAYILKIEKLKISSQRKGRREVFNSIMHGNVDNEPQRRLGLFGRQL
jgi:hypothetical protein